MSTAAILIHADGVMERLEPNDAVGRYIMRKSKCTHCSQPTGPDRKYVGHFASNHDTVRDGTSVGPAGNLGCVVFIEEPA
jgi:hypothetical protein